MSITASKKPISGSDLLRDYKVDDLCREYLLVRILGPAVRDAAITFLHISFMHFNVFYFMTCFLGCISILCVTEQWAWPTA